MGEYVYEEGIPNLEDESEESSGEDDDVPEFVYPIM